MSTPLQRAEELKSLISQYQAELSDIYTDIHTDKGKKTSQLISLLTNTIHEYIVLPKDSYFNITGIYKGNGQDGKEYSSGGYGPYTLYPHLIMQESNRDYASLCKYDGKGNIDPDYKPQFNNYTDSYVNKKFMTKGPGNSSYGLCFTLFIPIFYI